MQKRILFIYCNNPVAAFTFPEKLVETIKKDLPDCSITQIHSHDEFVKRISEPEILITWNFKKEWYAKAEKLRFILTPAAGKDWIEEDSSGRVKTIFGSFHGQLLSETLLAMILYFNRRFSRLIKNQADHIWDRNLQSKTKTIFGQNILIIGYGRIGTFFARTITSFSCNIRGLQRKHKNGYDISTGVEYIGVERLFESLSWADHVINLLSATEETRGFLTINHFKAMKKNAFFYNMGRGCTCVEKDLIFALETGVIAGAGIDVFEQEPLALDSKLWDMENVLISPHASCIFSDYIHLYYKEIKQILPTLICNP